jgi:hypothetical protein
VQTPCKKPLIFRPGNNFCRLRWTRKLTTMFTTARRSSLSRARWMRFRPVLPTCSACVLILYFLYASNVGLASSFHVCFSNFCVCSQPHPKARRTHPYYSKFRSFVRRPAADFHLPFPALKICIQILVSTWRPTEWVPSVFSSGLRRPGREADHLCTRTEVQINGSLPPLYLTPSIPLCI